MLPDIHDNSKTCPHVANSEGMLKEHVRMVHEAKACTNCGYMEPMITKARGLSHDKTLDAHLTNLAKAKDLEEAKAKLLEKEAVKKSQQK